MLQIVIYPPDSVNDESCDFALGLGASAVTLSALNDHHEWFSDPARPFWENAPAVKMIIQIDSTLDPTWFVQQLSHLCRWESIPKWETQTIPQRNWVAEGRKHTKPIQIHHRLWVVPTWETPPTTDAVCLRLDPGLAFGSGSHPTTRLCLEWLADQCRPDDQVLDYGCGSGILAIAAALLGGRVTATDNDPQALQSTSENARLNQVDISILEPEKVTNTHTLIVANILANPLIALAPILIRLLGSGGRIALSGILPRQKDSVRSAFEPWIVFDDERIRAGWVLLTGRKTA